jgi:hypothetical protein
MILIEQARRAPHLKRVAFEEHVELVPRLVFLWAVLVADIGEEKDDVALTNIRFAPIGVAKVTAAAQHIDQREAAQHAHIF